MADGLFGAAPWEVEQQQQQAQHSRAMEMSKMDANQWANYGLMSGTAGLARMLGAKNPAVEQAKRQEQIMGSGDEDLGTSAGMAAKADQFRKAGDLRTATALTLKANEMKRQEAAALLATRKEDRAQEQLDEVQKLRVKNEYEFKIAQLEQQKVRDADTAEGRRRADATDRYIAGLQAEMRRLGIETKAAASGGTKPLTPFQAAKQEKMKAESSSAIRAQDNDIVALGTDIDKVMTDPNLSRATGVSDYIWSRPGGAASQIEGQLDSIVNKLKAQGLKVLREGGGIGAITEKEWDILANQVANIDRKKGAEYVKGELEKVKLRMNEMKRNAAQRHAEQFGEEYTPSREAAPAPGAKPRIKFDANGNVIK